MTCPASLELLRDGRHSGTAPCVLEDLHFPHEARFAQTSDDWRTVTFKPGDTYETRSDETMGMPAQKPSRSKQDYPTPPDFIEACLHRFGPIAFDLAADQENTKADDFFSLEEGGNAVDALKQDWAKLDGNLWCNPPFGDLAPWAEHARHATFRVSQDPKRRHRHDWRVLLLTPASIGSNWFAEHVHGRALVLALSPRLSFDGANPYPKDLILSVFGERPGFDCWRWQ